MRKVIFKDVLDGVVLDRVIRYEEYSMPSVHFHPEYEIFYLMDGTRQFMIEDKTYTVGKCGLVLVDTMQIHKTAALGKAPHDRFLIELMAEPFSTFFVGLSGMSFRNLFKELAGVWEFREEERRFADDIFHTIADELRDKKSHYQIFVMMKIAELLLFLARLKENRRVDVPVAGRLGHIQIDSVVDYITENYDKHISLDLVCRRFYISKSYLCRVFKEKKGSTVQEYIHMCRIKKAQELLKDSNLSVTEISDSLGYISATHFERVFRKYMETTPLKYRQKMQLIEKKVRERKREGVI